MFSKFLEVDINTGIIGMVIVLFLCHFRWYERITYTQVAVCVLIFAFMVPAIFISIQMTVYSAIRNGEKF
jgi:cation/acetate symporter